MISQPINYAVFRKRIVDEVRICTGLVAIVAEPFQQQAPRPSLPYISFKIILPSQKYGYDSVTYSEDNSVYNVGGQRRMTVSFNSYAVTQEQAYNIMATWQACLELPPVQNRFRAAGMPVWGSTPVADLSQLLNTGWEGRAQMDGFFGVASNVTVDLGQIEKAQVSGDVFYGEEDNFISFEVP